MNDKKVMEMPNDRRLLQLCSWGKAALQLDDCLITSVSGDASFRRYFRLTHKESTWILVDSPPQTENNPAFVGIADLMFRGGVQVPQIIESDLNKGFFLLNDFGDNLLLSSLKQTGNSEGYNAAIDNLLAIQKISPAASQWELPRYDELLLRTELDLFSDWFVGEHLGIKIDREVREMLDATWDELINSALSQPMVLVHRDYHSRNIMLLDDGSQGVIDFQDAVVGPITYDLVSLLRDCYIRWPSADVRRWISEYLHRAVIESVMPGGGLEHFQHWFDWMGIQRHLKAIGIFARLKHRDNKPGYLQDIPRTLGYVRDIARRYSELADFSDWLEQQLIPVCEAVQQSTEQEPSTSRSSVQE